MNENTCKHCTRPIDPEDEFCSERCCDVYEKMCKIHGGEEKYEEYKAMTNRIRRSMI